MNARGTRRPGRRPGRDRTGWRIRQSVVPPWNPPPITSAASPGGCLVLAVAAIGLSGLLGAATIAAAHLI